MKKLGTDGCRCNQLAQNSEWVYPSKETAHGLCTRQYSDAQMVRLRQTFIDPIGPGIFEGSSVVLPKWDTMHQLAY